MFDSFRVSIRIIFCGKLLITFLISGALYFSCSLHRQHLMPLEWFLAHKHLENMLKEHNPSGSICRLVAALTEEHDRCRNEFEYRLFRNTSLPLHHDVCEGTLALDPTTVQQLFHYRRSILKFVIVITLISSRIVCFILYDQGRLTQCTCTMLYWYKK